MAKQMAYILLLISSFFMVACEQQDGDINIYPEMRVYYSSNNENWKSVNTIDVKDKTSVFDLNIMSDGRLKDVSIKSYDTQCTVEIIRHSEPEYGLNDRELLYHHVLRIDMRKEKRVVLTITHHEREYFSNTVCNIILNHK